MTSQALPAEYHALQQELLTHIDATRIFTAPEQRLAYGTDASFYRLIPVLVLRLNTLEEVIFTIRCCKKHQLPFTFRAAGTSLSGQALSDSVLITLSDDWRQHKIIDHGEKIALQPGVIGAHANQYLAPYRRKIGPDPASIDSCKIGGITANNSSGMCCGTAQNSYHTVESMKVVLNDGTQLDTNSEASIASFQLARPDLVEGIWQLHQQTIGNTALTQKIQHKYRLKNTTGYALNALIDYQDPIKIIEHLMIGSEGTLGFIAEVTYNTVPDYTHKASALLVFANIEQASLAVTALAQTRVTAVELMDGRSLQSVSEKTGMPSFIRNLDMEACALLLEVHAEDSAQLEDKCHKILNTITPFSLVESVPFTSELSASAKLWGIRKGLFPAVGAIRDVGTTVIIEDIAFPVEHLAEGVRDLQALFTQFNYHEAIIFGHALEGNLHFVFTQSFEQTSEVERYQQLMEKVCELVAVKYQGSLKAEHGTGRNMAPFVELEWGKDAYLLMQKIKKLFDPDALINPGVIINSDAKAYIKNLKPMPAADPLVDPCIECGFCEPVCPSRTLSLTPRQRIVLYRELESLRRQGASEELQALQKAYEYQGINTCAATGLCADRCPVGINTGNLVKKLRQTKYQKMIPIAQWSADHFSTCEKVMKAGLKINRVLNRLIGDKTMSCLSKGARAITKGRSPHWLAELPQSNCHSAAAPVRHSNSKNKKVVYLPSCASRAMGASSQDTDQRSLTEVTLSLLGKAGFEPIIPATVSELCCGMPYDSKGMTNIADSKLLQLETALWEASKQGTYPVLFDTSPCTHRARNQIASSMQVFEPSEFVDKFLLEHLSITPKRETIMLHVTCSARKMGLEQSMVSLAKRCAEKVVVPEHIQCCGWAGDKGFTTPELNQSALQCLKQQVPAGCTKGFSNSRTCEIGLSHHSGITYQSILYLVDQTCE
ncbi:FAD-binding oxidoreductase [Vibrio profundum]|uniref:FAD-binding and (Fe-S)-binding domain-containing protein n=1 Tax=Vibrio profundum TaxID=2910247 RepID=UPI003D0E626A